jgi:hypothetical protein
MSLRALFALAAPLLLVALLLPAPVLADNSVTNAIGTVQASEITTAPAAAGELLDGTAQSAATVPVAIGSAGNGNSVSNSIGTVQVGGENSADESLATVQASNVRTRPTAGVRATGVRAGAASPAATGSGRNSARRSAVTVQLGGGSSDRSAGRIDANRPAAAAPAVVVARVPNAASRTAPLARALPTTRSAERTPERTVRHGSGATADVDVDLRSLHARVQHVGIEPSFVVALDPLARLVLGGRIVVDPPAGGAERSLGTVQAGGVAVAPTLALETPIGTLRLDGQALGIAGGGNRASDSLGTAQVGGDNEASGSIGSVQVSGVSTGPRLTVNDSPLGDVALSLPLAIGGSGGNRAENSVGTAQVGGGNTARRSFVTLQVGASRTAAPPSCCSPMDGVSAPGGDTTPGDGPQSGGSRSINQSGAGTPPGTTPAPGSSGGPSGSGPGAAAGARGGGLPAPDGIAPDGEEPNAEGVLPASDSRRSNAGTAGGQDGQLPFTGLPLLFVGLVGLCLAAAGTAVRRAAG